MTDARGIESQYAACEACLSKKTTKIAKKRLSVQKGECNLPQAENDCKAAELKQLCLAVTRAWWWFSVVPEFLSAFSYLAYFIAMIVTGMFGCVFPMYKVAG